MNCPQCGNVLPDSATICPRCATAIRPASFSYLPPGTPPWPTMVPPGLFYASGALVQPAQQGVSVPTAQSAVKPKRSALGMFVIVALFILSPLVGVGATLGTLWSNGEFPVHSIQVKGGPIKITPVPVSPTPAASGQLPTPSSFQKTTSTELGVALQYPADWIEDSPQSNSSLVFVSFHPQQQLGIEFVVQHLSSDNSATIGSTTQLNQAILSDFSKSQGIHNFHGIAAASPQRTIGGVPWDEQDGAFTNDSGDAFHLVIISVQHNKLYYSIYFFVPNVVFDEAMQKYFQPMLDSFQFTS